MLLRRSSDAVPMLWLLARQLWQPQFGLPGHAILVLSHRSHPAHTTLKQALVVARLVSVRAVAFSGPSHRNQCDPNCTACGYCCAHPRGRGCQCRGNHCRTTAYCSRYYAAPSCRERVASTHYAKEVQHSWKRSQKSQVRFGNDLQIFQNEQHK